MLFRSTQTYKCLGACPEEDRTQEGAGCSEECPCEINENGIQMTCGSDHKCHACPEEDRTQEGASCSEGCPCEANEDGIQMTCGADHKCHTCPEGSYWYKPQTSASVEGSCCPVEGGLPNGQICTTDSCCLISLGIFLTFQIIILG